MQKQIRKRAYLYGIAAVLLATVLVSLCYQLGYIPQVELPKTSSFMSTFTSFDELKDFLKTKSTSQYGYPYYSTNGGKFLFNGAQVWGPAATGTNQMSDNIHSTTNVQVTGVDEADTVKTDGEYIYLLAGDNVSILRSYPPGEAQLLSKISINDMTPVGIFVNGERLAVLGSNYSIIQGPYLYATTSYVNEVTTYLEIYDISNRTDPALLKTFTTSGDYLNSRMIGDYVYIVAGQPAYYRLEVFPGFTADQVNLPSVGVAGNASEVPASKVYYSNVTDQYFMFTTIAALNIKDITQEANSKTLMIGGTSTMYVSLADIYVTYPAYDQTGYGYEQTSIYRIHIQNGTITPEAQGYVPGHVLNQYSMDHDGDYFRVATTAWGTTVITGFWNSTIKQSNDSSPISTPIVGTQQHSNVYVLDMNLTIVGRLENLAIGENFHSARFMGNRCYLVTFMMTDPLFVIDLSNPVKPIELGNLTIPGYSDYLHPYDENHLIGVGKETAASDSQYFAWYQGVKISLFDVSNASNPIQIANYTIGDRGTTSPVLTDPKAFLFDKSKNLLVIPVLEAKVDTSQYPPGEVPSGAYGQYVWQGAYVFNISLDGGLVLQGKISHMDKDTDIYNSDYYVQRALYIEYVLYTVSSEKVRLNNLADLAFIKDIEIN
jgi:inhibitor of cysteine peptidase